METFSHGPLRLSVSRSIPVKIGATLLATFFIGIPLLVILKIERAARRFPGASSLELQIVALPALVVVVVSLVSLLGVFRFRARLEGNVLEVRGAFTTRTVDLARAHVWLDTFPERSRARDRHPTGRRIPHLYLSAQERGGPKILLRLRLARGFLPPHELAALADAVESSRRSGPEAEQASRTAGLLRRLGADPAALIH
jgi:hypothetical protein